MSDIFRCPVCRGALSRTSEGYRCRPCARTYPIANGIPDFFVSESNHDFSDDSNTIWLDPEVVEARDTIYRLCSRELVGMAFCMGEIDRRTSKGSRVLEVGMGTGHFTRWLAEASKPGTEIHAFDFSWPIIEKAIVKTAGLPGISLFRANAREGLPFPDDTFDIVFLRLAPLGPRAVPAAQAAFELLRPGGWFFEAGWKEERFETPPTEWAIQHGFEIAEHHVWQYQRLQSDEEHQAWQIEGKRLAAAREARGSKHTSGSREGPCDPVCIRRRGSGFLTMTHENLTIARKPA